MVLFLLWKTRNLSLPYLLACPNWYSSSTLKTILPSLAGLCWNSASDFSLMNRRPLSPPRNTVSRKPHKIITQKREISTLRSVLKDDKVVFFLPSDPFLRPLNHHGGRFKEVRRSFEHVAFDDGFSGADRLILRETLGTSRHVEKVCRFFVY